MHVSAYASRRVLAPAGARRFERLERRILLTPAVCVVALITQVPFLLTVYYSLHSWNLLRPELGRRFVGLTNYAEILKAGDFWVVLGNTLLLTLGVLLLSMLLGLGLAMLLNRPFPGRALVRTLLITPFFVMPVVTGIVWKNMLLHPVYGLVTYLAGKLHLPAADLLTDRPLLAIALMLTWEWVPFFMLILLAGLQGVAPELVEACRLDGAGEWGVFRHVVLPHLGRFVTVAFLLGFIFLFHVFGEIYVTTSGGPGFASTNLPFMVYRVGFSGWNIGEASAIGVFIVIITTVIATYFNKLLSRTLGGEPA